MPVFTSKWVAGVHLPKSCSITIVHCRGFGPFQHMINADKPPTNEIYYTMIPYIWYHMIPYDTIWYHMNGKRLRMQMDNCFHWKFSFRILILQTSWFTACLHDLGTKSRFSFWILILQKKRMKQTSSCSGLLGILYLPLLGGSSHLVTG